MILSRKKERKTPEAMEKCTCTITCRLGYGYYGNIGYININSNDLIVKGTSINIRTCTQHIAHNFTCISVSTTQTSLATCISVKYTQLHMYIKTTYICHLYM